MGLRPWNIFKKTLFAARADAGAGRIPLTTQISLARARIQADEAAAGATFAQRLAVLLPSSALVWLLLLAAHRHYRDPERLRRLERESGGAVLLDFLGWRLAAHLGPYQLPNLVRARLHEEPLRLLSEPLLLDHERARALGRLSQLTQRHAVAARLSPAAQWALLRAAEPLLRDVFALPEEQPGARASGFGSSTSHRAAALRIVLDVVAATPPEERAVPAWVLSGLVLARGSPWSDGPQGEEVRATLLLQLLRTPENCTKAATLPEVLGYLRTAGFKAKADTLFPVRAYLLSGETLDVLRRCARLIVKQAPGALDVPPRCPRDTPSLQVKHDIRNVWTSALLTMGWATFRAWRGVLDLKAALALGRACAGALAGMGLLEGLWHLEEGVIGSAWYYEDERFMLPASAGMCIANSLAFAWALQYPVAVPFAAIRLVKDDFLDAHRSFDL